MREDQNACGTLGACAGRQNAKAVLRERIERMEREAARMRLLHDTLPDAMLPEADEALWQILMAARQV